MTQEGVGRWRTKKEKRNVNLYSVHEELYEEEERVRVKGGDEEE